MKISDHFSLSLALRRGWLCIAAALSLHSYADTNNVQHFARHSVYYTVFNSTFLQEDVAKEYAIKRSQFESLINISVVPRGEDFGGLPAKLSGTVTNLMQQQKQLDFKEINEGGVVYFLAPVRINGEEVVHVNIQVTPENADTPLNVTFTQKLYSD